MVAAVAVRAGCSWLDQEKGCKESKSGMVQRKEIEEVQQKEQRERAGLRGQRQRESDCRGGLCWAWGGVVPVVLAVVAPAGVRTKEKKERQGFCREG